MRPGRVAMKSVEWCTHATSGVPLRVERQQAVLDAARNDLRRGPTGGDQRNRGDGRR